MKTLEKGLKKERLLDQQEIHDKISCQVMGRPTSKRRRKKSVSKMFKWEPRVRNLSVDNGESLAQLEREKSAQKKKASFGMKAIKSSLVRKCPSMDVGCGGIGIVDEKKHRMLKTRMRIGTQKGNEAIVRTLRNNNSISLKD